MVLSKRERNIFFVTLASVALLVLYHFVLSPLLDQQTAMGEDRRKLTLEVADMNGLIGLQREMGAKWRQMLQGGLKNDSADAESQVLHAIQDWADGSGVALSLQKPDRMTDKTRLAQISFLATGSGTMKSLRDLLWKIKTAAIPIKVTQLTVSARKEGVDDLSFTLRLSTVHQPPRPGLATAASSPASDTSGGR